MTISANYPSINPSLDLDFANSVALDPRVTFTRAGTGTYYDGSTSAIAEQNLLTYSQQFDNSIWTKNSTTYTANTQTAPDGTTTAGTFTSSSSIATAYINQTISNVLGYALSFYAKAGTSNFACITTNSVGCYANFNISTGAVASSANCTAAITLSSNGWYRCTITGVQSGIYFMILGKDADPEIGRAHV